MGCEQCHATKELTQYWSLYSNYWSKYWGLMPCSWRNPVWNCCIRWITSFVSYLSWSFQGEQKSNLYDSYSSADNGCLLQGTCDHLMQDRLTMFWYMREKNLVYWMYLQGLQKRKMAFLSQKVNRFLMWHTFIKGLNSRLTSQAHSSHRHTVIGRGSRS